MILSLLIAFFNIFQFHIDELSLYTIKYQRFAFIVLIFDSKMDTLALVLFIQFTTFV